MSTERKFKIYHRPSKTFVKSINIRNGATSLNKKGRLWLREHDVLMAWDTIDKREIGDYVIQQFELVITKEFTRMETEDLIKIKDDKYAKDQLAQEIRSLESNIKREEEKINNTKDNLPAMKQRLEELKKK